MPRLLCPGYCTPCHLPAFLPVCCPGYSAQATEHPASCLPACLTHLPACLPVSSPGYSAQATATPCLLLACLFAGQATLPRLLHTLPPACLPVCWPGYSTPTCTAHLLPTAAEHPASWLCCPGYSAQANPAHPASCLLPACLAAQATLPRLLNPATCLPACLLIWAGYSAKATAHPATCLPACLLARLLCPGYCKPCLTCLPARLLARLLCPANPARLTACLPACCVCWPGYSAQATAHPADLPACPFAGQATLPRLPCTPCHCLPACLLARLFCPGYSAQATANPATCLPSCLFAGQATLPRLLHTLPPACAFVPRLLCPGY